MRTQSLDLHWRSYELRPEGASPMPDAVRQRIEAARPRLETIAREQYGLVLNSGPFGVSSRLALVGAKAAEALGQGAAYHAVVFRAYWQEAQDIADREVLLAIAERIGLDRMAFAATLDDPAHRQAVLADAAEASQAGMSGVPALLFAHKYLVSGAQPYATLLDVVQQVRGRLATGR